MRTDREGLRIKFGELLKSTNAQARGKEFENLLGDLLELEGFRVWHNPRSATPRQTDLAIEFDQFAFLIEAKWKNKKIDIADLDNLRSRLRRAAPTTWGCFLSISEYNPRLLRDLKEHRTPPIILFNAFEIHSLFNGQSSAKKLIQQKVTNFRIHGKIWFSGTEQRQEALPYNRRRGEEIKINGQSTLWIRSGSKDYDVIFARSPYIGYRNAQVVSARLHLNSVADLNHVFRLANEVLGISGWGPFTVYQANTSWHGIGVQRFIKCIENWENRYELEKFQRFHHSEELAYFEEFAGGFLGISCRQRVGERSYLHSGTLEIALPGIPIELARYNEFFQSIAERPLFFDFREDMHDLVVHVDQRIKLDVIGLIVGNPVDEADQLTITGLIARNPFWGGSFSEILSGLPTYKAEWVGEAETIICDLLHWLDYGDEVDEMLLKTISLNSIAGLKLVSFECTWSNLVKRAHPPNLAEFERITKKPLQKYDNETKSKRRKNV
ncbi:MAG: restriction endonuclease [Sciscionella sp.]